MAIVTFGATARGHNSVALFNTTSNVLSYGILHGGTHNPNTYKNFTFNTFDALFRGTNVRNNDLYSVNSAGAAFQDDVSELANLITSGQLVVHSATFANGSFTTGSQLASASYADGSVAFS